MQDIKNTFRFYNNEKILILREIEIPEAITVKK